MTLSTVFLLMAEYNTSDIPLEIIAHKYFGHSKENVKIQARHQRYPFPVFRGGSQKIQWLVNVIDLANWINHQRQKSLKKHHYNNWS